MKPIITSIAFGLLLSSPAIAKLTKPSKSNRGMSRPESVATTRDMLTALKTNKEILAKRIKSTAQAMRIV